MISNDIFLRIMEKDPSMKVLKLDQTNVPHAYPGGFSAWMANNPAGYVQLEETRGFITDTLERQAYMQISCLGPNEVVCGALYRRLFNAIQGTVEYPSQWREIAPPDSLILSDNLGIRMIGRFTGTDLNYIG